MKKRAYIVMSLISALTIVTAFLWSHKRVEAEMKFTKNDSSGHGVSIITVADPTFEELISAYSGRHPQAPIDDLKPFSIFIQNTTEKTIVGFKVRWVFTKTDGTTVDKVTTRTTLWALTNTLGADTEAALQRTNGVIGPKSYGFVSLAAPPESLTGRVVNLADQSGMREELKVLNSELQNYTEVSVNLDGIFFDDGGFTGTDDKYYEDIKAEVDANQDVLKEIQSGIQKGKSGDEIFKSIEEAANGPDVRLWSESTSRDHYQYVKKLAAQEVLNIRKHKGEDKAFEHMRMRLGRAWPVVRKLGALKGSS
jgi:hypothetical protein